MSILNTLRQLVLIKKMALQLQVELAQVNYHNEILPHICKGVNVQNYTFTTAIETIVKEMENEIMRHVEDLDEE